MAKASATDMASRSARGPRTRKDAPGPRVPQADDAGPLAVTADTAPPAPLAPPAGERSRRRRRGRATAFSVSMPGGFALTGERKDGWLHASLTRRDSLVVEQAA